MYKKTYFSVPQISGSSDLLLLLLLFYFIFVKNLLFQYLLCLP